jgi:hypothetical protein
MAQTHVYLFTSAPSKDEAADKIERWLEEYAGREFYEGWDIEKDGIVPVSALSKEFVDKELAEVEVFRGEKAMEALQAEADGDRFRQGCALRHVSDILCEHLCGDMPWYNTEHCSWHVPGEKDRLENPDDTWWAVKTAFYY